MAFKLSCPRCKAKPEDARLEVVGGTFEANRMYLERDGFNVAAAKSFNTDDEKVYCNACNEFMSLGECLEEDT